MRQANKSFRFLLNYLNREYNLELAFEDSNPKVSKAARGYSKHTHIQYYPTNRTIPLLTKYKTKLVLEKLNSFDKETINYIELDYFEGFIKYIKEYNYPQITSQEENSILNKEKLQAQKMINEL